MIVIPANPEHAEWLRVRTGYRLGGGWQGIAALDSRSVTRGLVAYDGWTENAVQMHIALDTPIAFRWLLRPAFSYPFEEVGVGVALGMIAASNTRSLELAQHAGFAPLYRIQNGWADGVDLVLLQLRREDCRWLGVRQAPQGATLPGKSPLIVGG